MKYVKMFYYCYTFHCTFPNHNPQLASQKDTICNASYMLSVINLFYNRLIEFITDAVPNVELQMNIFVISIVKQITTGVTDVMSGFVTNA